MIMTLFKMTNCLNFSVLPGITGYTQAYYRNSISVRDRRLNDAWYAENYSFSLDIKIFIRTIITVIKLMHFILIRTMKVVI